MQLRFASTLAALGLAAVVTACGTVSQASTAVTPPAPTAATGAATTPNPGGANRPARAPNVAGTVQGVNGSTITVQGAQGGNPATFQFTNVTTFFKQTTATLTDIKPGTEIVAFGTSSSGVLQAQRIQIGAGPGQGRRAGGGPGGNGGNTNRTVVNGAVDSVSGNTVTVKSTDGSSAQVQLAPNGRIVQQTAGTPADIVQGKFVIAVGQQQNGALVATSVSLSDTAPAGRNAQAAPTPASQG
jgi:hypothetical protein